MIGMDGSSSFTKYIQIYFAIDRLKLMKKNGVFGMSRKNPKQKRSHAHTALHWMHSESCC